MPAPNNAQIASKPKPGGLDATGMKAQELERQKKEKEAALRAAEDAALEEDRAFNAKPVDYSGRRPDDPLPEVIAPDPLEDEELEEVTITMKRTLEDMTYGREIMTPPDFDKETKEYTPATLGNPLVLNFKEGRRYIVPRHLYLHLERIGAVWH